MRSAEPYDDNQSETTYTPPVMRVFETVYVTGEKETFSSHFIERLDGDLVFIDEVALNNGTGRVKLYHRRVIAAGQWRHVTEIASSSSGSRVN